MALDGLSLSNIGIISEISPKDIAKKAEQESKASAETAVKKVQELEKQRLDPEQKREKRRRRRNNQSKKRRYYTQKAYQMEVSTLDAEKNDKIIELTSQTNTYKVIYNNDSELIEIIDLKSGIIHETLSLEELKGFIMKVKNPLGIIVDRKV